MNNEVKEYLEKELMSLGDKFQEGQKTAKTFLDKRNILLKSVNTINKSMEGLVNNGSIIMAKSEAIRSMLKE